MKKNMIKVLFLALIVIVIILVLSFSAKSGNKDVKDNTSTTSIIENPRKSIDLTQFVDENPIDYDNITEFDVVKIQNEFGDRAYVTDEGVYVFAYGSDTDGGLEKIITCTWPEKEKFTQIIPMPDFGHIFRIEYNDNYAMIYVENTAKNDVKDYIKSLEDSGFNNNETNENSKAVIKFSALNSDDNLIELSYKNSNNVLSITFVY